MLELTVAELHKRIREGTTTCAQVAEWYLDRIRASDKCTGLNSMIVLNPKAIQEARALDEEFSRKRLLRPLHGAPVILKDNYDTCDLQTSAGSLALSGSLPVDDACQVRRLRDAGAVVLGKSNMAEWAFSPYATESSIAGITRNPYDLNRVPAGSSGGTAAAIAANFGIIGMGTDTGNSIRGPSSHCCLVGVRTTMGLASRDGIVPLYSRNDVGGPMCRTVEDAARVLEATVGFDPADPVTTLCRGRDVWRYSSGLSVDALEGTRIGVFRYFTDQPTADAQVQRLFNEALSDLGDCGAELMDPLDIKGFSELTANIWCNTFQRDLDRYLATLRDPKYKTLKEIVASGLYCDANAERLRSMAVVPPPTCGDVYFEVKNLKLMEAVYDAMKMAHVDVLVYPTWSNPPRLVGDLESPHGDNSQLISPHTGMPALSVPMGFAGGLPAGLQMVGKLFTEPMLLACAYAYEQATGHRRTPASFPER